MFLGEVTKTVYLNVKHNLVCETAELRPDGLDEVMKRSVSGHEVDDKILGVMSISQISLLRTQLKSDLRIHGQVYSSHLGEHELCFSEYGRVDIGRKPWTSPYMPSPALVALTYLPIDSFPRLAESRAVKRIGSSQEGRPGS
jgi:hypothetical protein